MAKGKDITALLAVIDAAIDPGAPAKGINATSHNAALLALVEAVGWWSGLNYYLSNADGDLFDGTIEIGTQNYNDSTPSIKITKNDTFGADNSSVLALMGADSVAIIRDIDGELITWEVVSVTTGNTGGVDYYAFEMKAAATNSDRTLGALVQKQASIQLFPNPPADSTNTPTFTQWVDASTNISPGTKWDIQDGGMSTKIWMREDDMELIKKVNLRGFVKANALVNINEVILDIDVPFYNVYEPKIIYLGSSIPDEVMYKCKWTGTTLIALESIAANIELNLDSYYYNLVP